MNRPVIFLAEALMSRVPNLLPINLATILFGSPCLIKRICKPHLRLLKLLFLSLPRHQPPPQHLRLLTLEAGIRFHLTKSTLTQEQPQQIQMATSRAIDGNLLPVAVPAYVRL